MAGEQTKTARRGPPRVGNGSGGRLDAEERAHALVEKGSNVKHISAGLNLSRH